MSIKLIKRFSESSFAEIITKSTTFDKGKLRIIPDGKWDLLISRHNGQTQASLMNAPMLQAADIQYVADQESLVITFAASAYMTSGRFLNRGIHMLPVIANRAIRFCSDIIEIPTFDNAEAFIKKLHERNLLANDKIVQDAISKAHVSSYSDRTKQRHFQQITGMTLSSYKQIQRAQKAYNKLRHGESAIDIAYELEYSDQFHMSNSLKRILGQTPTEIVQSR